MIVVVDYGMGNLRSVSKALDTLGASVRITNEPALIERAQKLIVPGVGAFGAAVTELERRGLVAPIIAAIRRQVPYLGICLGLQLLFDASDESPGTRGFGVLPGRVRRFPIPLGDGLKVPHMGWNRISPRADGQGPRCPLLNDIPDESFFYFVHSYYGDPADRSLVARETEYGVRFASMLWRDRLFATQFHPEKSQALGLKLLSNFLSL